MTHGLTRKVAASDFDDDTKVTLIWALAGSKCEDCRREAFEALITIGEITP